ncbi:MAG: hypothetical protein COT91_01055 [Candidatus Doudnabacteria bacterium CG10_big_fil_rev_8_21_14_0_10_41_10]|uniref:AMP nucleosidase n=1 Tax=Candidatus Doudnabacteria bacterium CG10_big_fil_rev_8_21_14_0_10_41_10 TaxID=1974551 RepID=A0A2H0VEH3_9BACT|nr:MAG: hypothetical protein COT91_01055 [Candidatus Doudnabacteria bacterium CG10_big_fil_rev_8_21_14_0_10_41_10]
MTAKAEFEKAYPAQKIFVPGTCDKAVRVKNRRGWVKIRGSKTSGMLEFLSSGLVVAFNGAGDEPNGSPAYKDAFRLSRAIVDRGGVVLNGGRNTGIMQATGEAAGKACLGVNFAEQVKKNKAHSYGTRLVIHPLTRLAILTWCAPVVVIYGGSLGTFHELVNALVAVKNHSLYGFAKPKLFINEFWRKPLLQLIKSGIIPRSYIADCEFFSKSKDIIKQISA